VYAMSSELGRDMYFINLQEICSDSQLNHCFSTVPQDSIIVMDDIDAQTAITHARSRIKNDDNVKSKWFSLSTLLHNLDGRTLAEGTIVIMTTNHLNTLDPALIRPGRIDVSIKLGYATKSQIIKMFRNVMENNDVNVPDTVLARMKHETLPPCEVLTLMIIYR